MRVKTVAGAARDPGTLELTHRLVAQAEGSGRALARELHDRIGQKLSGININLDIIRSQLCAACLRRVSPRLRDTQALLEQAGADVRDVMAELHPPSLDDFGLMAALRGYAELFGARGKLPVTVRGADLVPRLPLATETALFRIAQGALDNAGRHAHAGRVRMRLAATAHRATLTVTDDGVGFDTSRRAPRHPCWGIAIMRERAHAIGATLSIASARGKGTTVRVDVAR